MHKYKHVKQNKSAQVQKLEIGRTNYKSRITRLQRAEMLFLALRDVDGTASALVWATVASASLPTASCNSDPQQCDRCIA